MKTTEQIQTQARRIHSMIIGRPDWIERLDCFFRFLTANHPELKNLPQ